MNHKVSDLLKYTSPSGWFSFYYTEAWEIEVSENCTTLYKGNGGVGALQISAYETETPQSAHDSLIEYLSDEGIEAAIKTQIVNQGQQIAHCSYEENDSYTKIWFITRGIYLLFMTYNCELSSKALEIEEVDTIVESLQVML